MKFLAIFFFSCSLYASATKEKPKESFRIPDNSPKSIELYNKCAKELVKHCKDGRPIPACYRKYKKKLSKDCQSRDVATILQMDMESLKKNKFIKEVMDSKCMKNISKNCTIPSPDKIAKNPKEAIGKYNQCLMANMKKHEKSCAKEWKASEATSKKEKGNKTINFWRR